MIRTLVVAPSAPAREALVAIVRADTRLALADADPDVVLERRVGRVDGFDAPTVALVEDPRDAWAATLGAPGEPYAYAILGNDASPGDVATAVVAVAAGLVAVEPRTLAASAVTEERLSAREIEVLGELARGAANKAIAARLGISEHTVKFHVASLFAKLGVASRTEAVTHGIRRGLIMI